MSDDTTTPDEGGTWKAPADQAELDKIVESRLARERAKYADYDDVKAKAAEFDKAQDKNKTELEKAAERAAKAEAAAATAQQEAWRASVALDEGLTPTQAKRLVGTTREELLADAQELKKDLRIDGKKPPRAPDQKRNDTSPEEEPMREFADRLFRRD
jgi:hypothetical protein